MAFKLKPRAQSTTLAPIYKFTAVGQSVEGVYQGQRQGKAGFAPLLIIGETAISAKKQLVDDFANIPVGALVRVTFQGKVNTKGGKTFNTFDVEVDEDAGQTLPAGTSAVNMVPVGEDYATLAAKLTLTPNGGTLKKAIEDMFPEPAVRLEKVKTALRERGVAV
jgi:hypothetical protein